MNDFYNLISIEIARQKSVWDKLTDTAKKIFKGFMVNSYLLIKKNYEITSFFFL